MEKDRPRLFMILKAIETLLGGLTPPFFFQFRLPFWSLGALLHTNSSSQQTQRILIQPKKPQRSKKKKRKILKGIGHIHVVWVHSAYILALVWVRHSYNKLVCVQNDRCETRKKKKKEKTSSWDLRPRWSKRATSPMFSKSIPKKIQTKPQSLVRVRVGNKDCLETASRGVGLIDRGGAMVKADTRILVIFLKTQDHSSSTNTNPGQFGFRQLIKHDELLCDDLEKLLTLSVNNCSTSGMNTFFFLKNGWWLCKLKKKIFSASWKTSVFKIFTKT